MRRRDSHKTIIQVKVVPRSAQDVIMGQENGVFRIKLTAPPVEGRANKALKAFLAKKLGLPKGHVEVVSGEHSRMKAICISGLASQEIYRVLEQDLQQDVRKGS